MSAPSWVPLRDIDAAVREKGGWILAKLAEQRERARAARGRARSSGATARRSPFLGEPVTRRRSTPPATLAAGDGARSTDAGSRRGEAAPLRRLHVGLPHDAGAERIRDAVQSWLQRQARRVFEERCRPFRARGSACA